MSVDILLDTQIAIWFLEGDRRSAQLIGDLLDDDSSTVSLSAASLFEIAIKHSIGKLAVSSDEVRSIVFDHGGLELPITASHASAYAVLPLHHRDPFDRMLVAQAMAEEMTLVTVDRQLAAYRDVVRLRGV